LAAKKKDASSQMPQPIFPMKNPGIFSMAAAFLIGIFASLMTPDTEAQDKFDAEKVREYVGIGAE
jgi:cation/acetate symporter